MEDPNKGPALVRFGLVEADFARTLERELAAVIAAGNVCVDRCERLERELEAQKVCISESVDSRWVPVSEFKPQDGEVVLCYWPTNPPSMQSLTYLASDAPDSHDAWRDLFDNDEDEPTHWMPLPKVPKHG